MIFPPTKEELAPFLASCIRYCDVRDVRKMRAAQDDAEVDQERRDRLAKAKQRSRARIGRRGH